MKLLKVEGEARAPVPPSWRRHCEYWILYLSLLMLSHKTSRGGSGRVGMHLPCTAICDRSRLVDFFAYSEYLRVKLQAKLIVSYAKAEPHHVQPTVSRFIAGKFQMRCRALVKWTYKLSAWNLFLSFSAIEAFVNRWQQ